MGGVWGFLLSGNIDLYLVCLSAVRLLRRVRRCILLDLEDPITIVINSFIEYIQCITNNARYKCHPEEFPL